MMNKMCLVFLLNIRKEYSRLLWERGSCHKDVMLRDVCWHFGLNFAVSQKYLRKKLFVCHPYFEFVILKALSLSCFVSFVLTSCLWTRVTSFLFSRVTSFFFSRVSIVIAIVGLVSKRDFPGSDVLDLTPSQPTPTPGWWWEQRMLTTGKLLNEETNDELVRTETTNWWCRDCYVNWSNEGKKPS